MIKTSKSIVFFGSGSVAAKSLELLSNNFYIEAVITKPKQSNSRDPVPVIDAALKLGVKLFTPTNKNELDKLFDENIFTSKLGVLIDYGIIVSSKVINYFKLGIINSHFSLLPIWRGADPISFSILNGDKFTGVSLMLINEGIDEGNLIAQEKIGIEHLDSIKLTNYLINLSNSMLKKYLPMYLSGKITPYVQSAAMLPSYSRKLTKEDGHIDWNKPANQIEREIRAFINWPKSFTNIYNIPVIITQVNFNNSSGTPGSIYYSKSVMNIKCLSNSLDILKLKPVGKPEMDISSFIAGYKNRFI
ncbi:MAG TPA: methionyl-tRNA formyltransferase [Candidatus Dormibacteraeota bacterium]|nr:methionyl-tRNA formyltransferase [Candidatus Dormibacteraeota bacterium]